MNIKDKQATPKKAAEFIQTVICQETKKERVPTY